MSNLEHLIENSLSELEKFVGSGEDVNVFNFCSNCGAKMKKEGEKNER